MKIINISKELGIYDIGKVREVDLIINKIQLGDASEIEINLEECLIDYPATGKLMDKILLQLEKVKKTDKKLSIIYDCDLSEATLLNWLFLGSTFFNISEKKELVLDELKPIILELLKKKAIKMEIFIHDDDGQILNTYKYE